MTPNLSSSCRPPADLIPIIQAGGAGATGAMTRFVALFEHVVDGQVAKCHVPWQNREDAHQEGLLALLFAARAYDCACGVRFEVVAVRRIRDAVLGVCRSQVVVENHDDQAAVEEDLCDVFAVRGFVVTLTPLQREIVYALHWERKSQAEVARERGTSRVAVNRALARVYAIGREIFPDPSAAITPVLAA